MIRNLSTKSNPCIVHAPGPKWNQNLHRDQNPLWEKIVGRFFSLPSREVVIPDELTIITFNSSLEESVLERSAKKNGIKLSVLGRGTTQWINTLKISLASDFLDAVRTKFVLILDSNDVIITDIPKNILSMFESKAVFGAEKVFWPQCGNLTSESEKIQSDLNPDSPYKFLNAGTVLGKTEFLKRYYDDLRKIDVDDLIEMGSLSTSHELPRSSLIGSEQLRHQCAFEKHRSHIQIDSECKLFQVTVFHKEGELIFEPKML